MEEATFTDRTDVRIELQVFIEDDIKALDSVRQADRYSCDINRDDIVEQLGFGNHAEDS